MCGIISVLTNNNKFINIMSDGLQQLQNRGYDSVGICSIMYNKFLLNKCSSIENTSALELLEKCYSQYVDSFIGIGHTRWATHGESNNKNAHPHISSDNKFAIVHNGIVENYIHLKEILLKEGYTFISETDSEVIVNLLSLYYSKNLDIVKSINQVNKILEGGWALSILCVDTPDIIYCTRKDNPLLIGMHDDYVIVTSEQSGFSNYLYNYFILDNYDICIIEKIKDKITIKTNNIYSTKNIIQEEKNIRGLYTHWTLKEIYDQTNSINNVINFNDRRICLNNIEIVELDKNKNNLLQIDNLILLGCGTSFNACMVGVFYFKDICRFNSVQIFDGADFNEKDIHEYGKTVLILLSQSGETKDLYRCIEIAKKRKLFTIGVINVVNSLISREVDCVCYLNAGREIAVASTKSFTSQCVFLSMMSIWFSQHTNAFNEKRTKYIADLNILQTNITDMLSYIDFNIKKYITLFSNTSCFIIGTGKSYAIAKEGSLKIKEIAYIHSEGFSSSSLKHGPFALLCKDFPVIMIALNDDFYIKNENVYNEIKSRNSPILFITDNKDALNSKENVILIPENICYGNVLAVIVLQLLSYNLALNKGINPDFPKNLAKVVTVE